jgi:hypothetical protein
MVMKTYRQASTLTAADWAEVSQNLIARARRPDFKAVTLRPQSTWKADIAYGAKLIAIGYGLGFITWFWFVHS